MECRLATPIEQGFLSRECKPGLEEGLCAAPAEIHFATTKAIIET